MNTTLIKYTVREIVKGFIYNELEGKGLFGLSGHLTIQPEYQRNYLYAKEKKEAGVIDSLIKEYPLGLIFFNEIDEDTYEILDGQQRITSIGRFITGKFAILDENKHEQLFSSLPSDKQQKILDSELLVYLCKGTESEIKEWFRTINIAGIPLNDQEMLNAIYSGPFVSLAKAEFSNSSNANIQKWSAYITGSVLRQDYLATSISWLAAAKNMHTEGYLAEHRFDNNIVELKTYFNTVIDWVSSVFIDVFPEQRGLEWGRLYEDYHRKAYDSVKLKELVSKYYEDFYVKSKRGIFEYVLGGESDPKLLQIRLFDDVVKKTVYSQQTSQAKAVHISNCPICAQGIDSNKQKIWELKDMDADHVTAWSKGGATNIENCQMLCKTHNRAKGNY